jgi:hypothetical protein
MEPAILSLIKLGREKILIETKNLDPKDRSSSDYSYKNGFMWDNKDYINTDNLSSCYYYIEIRNKNGVSIIPFILSPKITQDIAIISSTNTWSAYNDFFKSNYRDHRPLKYKFKDNFWIFAKLIAGYDRKEVKITFLPQNRPNLRALEILKKNKPEDHVLSQDISAEWILPAFLEEKGIEYCVYSDDDFAFDPRILESKLIIFNVHSEYWSQEMMFKLKAYLDKGGNVLFASGNNIYRQIEYYKHGIIVNWQMIKPQITSSLTGSVYNQHGYNTYAPYKIFKNNHWIFNGIEDSFFGEFSSVREMGRNGASGLETDKPTIWSDGYEILAIGLNENFSGGAHVMYKEFIKHKNWIVNMSSVVFTGSLFHDRNSEQIVMNIISQAKDSNPV